MDIIICYLFGISTGMLYTVFKRVNRRKRKYHFKGHEEISDMSGDSSLFGSSEDEQAAKEYR